MEPLREPSFYFPCDQCQTLSLQSYGPTLPCGVERYYNNFILKRSAVKSKRGRKNPGGEEERVAIVYPSIDSITGAGGDVEVMFDHLTGTVKNIDKRKVLQQYQGREVELLLKIQVPWSLMGPLMNEDLMAYNKSRDFRVTIKNSDKDCGKIREKILKDGYMCINPGMKLFFRAVLLTDFSLTVFLDQTKFQNW